MLATNDSSLDYSSKPAPAEREVPFGSRLRSLDGLRGLAVLAVVAFHTLRIKGGYGIGGALWAWVMNSAWAGVDLFFVLSGFLITGILLDSRGTSRYFTNFYARRTLRIFPLYYAVLITALLIAPAVLGMQRLPPLYPRLLENQIWLWTYLANFIQARESHMLPGFGHFWTLAVEEQFYWFWPLVVYFSSRRILLRLCVAACVLVPLLRLFLMAHGSSPWALRQYTFTRFDTLLFGAIVAIVVRDPLLVRRARAAAPALALVAAIGLLAIGFRFGYIPFEAPETLVLGYSALGILFATIIFKVATQSTRLNTILSAGTLRWFGKYSYAIYVFHWPVAQALQGAIERRLLPLHSEVLTVACYFGSVLAISSAVAWISWNTFEAHFLKLKRLFEYSDQRPSEHPAAVAVLSPAHAVGISGISTPLPRR